ncbi:hypothetical protein BDN71DRAFT_1436093 [Pleurotus eryngii]|uniref:Uncharacterized protein n=1 Tax=Pleurotus eryngii TaxID=5323 RepID=A0A9P5ZK26_PLEER|nr:hypothetical protein BDN71DRAFT_1436093 [Pleurotus eryngii]
MVHGHNDTGRFHQNPEGFPSTIPFTTGGNVSQPIGTFPTGQVNDGIHMEPMDYRGTHATSAHGNTPSQQSMVHLPLEPCHLNEQIPSAPSLGAPTRDNEEDDHTSQWVSEHHPSFVTMEQLDDQLEAFATTITRSIQLALNQQLQQPRSVQNEAHNQVTRTPQATKVETPRSVLMNPQSRSSTPQLGDHQSVIGLGLLPPNPVPFGHQPAPLGTIVTVQDCINMQWARNNAIMQGMTTTLPNQGIVFRNDGTTVYDGTVYNSIRTLLHQLTPSQGSGPAIRGESRQKRMVQMFTMLPDATTSGTAPPHPTTPPAVPRDTYPLPTATPGVLAGSLVQLPVRQIDLTAPTAAPALPAPPVLQVPPVFHWGLRGYERLRTEELCEATSKADDEQHGYLDEIHDSHMEDIEIFLGAPLNVAPGTKPASNIPRPTKYEGNSDVTLNQYGGPQCEWEQVSMIESHLVGDASVWYNEMIQEMYHSNDNTSMGDIINGLYDQFIKPTAMHDATQLFYATQYDPTKGILELYHEMDTRTRCMVNPPDENTFKRHFIQCLPWYIMAGISQCGINLDIAFTRTLVQTAKLIEDGGKYMQIWDEMQLSDARLSSTTCSDNRLWTAAKREQRHAFLSGTNLPNSAIARDLATVAKQPVVPSKTLKCHACGHMGHIASSPLCTKYGHNRLTAVREQAEGKDVGHTPVEEMGEQHHPNEGGGESVEEHLQSPGTLSEEPQDVKGSQYDLYDDGLYYDIDPNLFQEDAEHMGALRICDEQLCIIIDDMTRIDSDGDHFTDHRATIDKVSDEEEHIVYPRLGCDYGDTVMIGPEELGPE